MIEITWNLPTYKAGFSSKKFWIFVLNPSEIKKCLVYLFVDQLSYAISKSIKN